MPSISIHQTIHGYREGHRLLSSSLSLGADAARAMLVLSDMSGPAMQPGFDEYITGYPLPGSAFFVFAKTWYAPEMQRPGCVWTHSFLLSREQLSQISALNLASKFRRPQQETMESTAMRSLELDQAADGTKVDGFPDPTAAALLVEAVLGQGRPVIVPVEKASQLEPTILRLWEELWPAARARFSFCTGALMPRSVAGVLMDLQVVPRAIPSSQFRKSAGAALVIDLRTLSAGEAWVEHFLEGVNRGDSSFRLWLDIAAGTDASRGAVPSLIPIFVAWCARDSSTQSVLGSITAAKELDPSIRARLLGMLFDRANAESGGLGRRGILQEVSVRRDTELRSSATMFEDQTRRLFEDERGEGVALVLNLLGSEITEVGERVLRAAVHLLSPSDLESFSDAQAPYLPTIVGANYQLASSSALWDRVGNRNGEVLSLLSSMSLKDEERLAVVDAIISSRCNISVDALLRFGGKAAAFRGLSAISSGKLQLSWSWRSAFGAQPDTVLAWLESLSSPSLHDLKLGSSFMSPKFTQPRLAAVWKIGISSAGEISSRVAAFGLTLAFWENNVKSPLFAVCFQPTYDAAASSRLEYDEWEWVREYAPSTSYWKDWDKCERIAKAIARLLEKQSASLDIVFDIVRSRQAIRKVCTILDDDWGARLYLKSLRKAAELSPAGTLEQREALLNGW